LLAATQSAGVVLKSDLEWRTVEARKDGRDGFKVVKDGDFVISLRSFEGGIEFSRTQGIISPAYTVLRRIKGHGPYFKYLFKSAGFLTGLKRHQKGIRDGQAIAFSTLQGDLIPFPPIREQMHIAAWLDLQTQRVDERIELLGRKRELLLKLRQSLIDELIQTGGTSPTMVETGQAALQRLPNHWTLSKFKNKVFFREGPGIMAADFMEAGVPLLRIGNITPGLIAMTGCNFVAPEKVARQWRQFRLKLGDLIISASASTGIVSEVGESAVGAIPYTGLIILRPKAGMSKNFLRYFVVSKPFLDQIEDHLKGSTIHHFGPTHLRQMLIPVPPPREQDEIAAILDQQTTRIDKQVVLIDRLEALLKEHRKALIHEAVTGKIDPSNYEPTAQSA
jgi:type I restriction enzyme S subunit